MPKLQQCPKRQKLILLSLFHRWGAQGSAEGSGDQWWFCAETKHAVHVKVWKPTAMAEMITRSSTGCAQLSEGWGDLRHQMGSLVLEMDGQNLQQLHRTLQVQCTLSFTASSRTFIMMSLVFIISLKGNKTASSHIYICTERRRWNKAFLLMIERDAVQLQIPTLALTHAANKAASDCLSISYFTSFG